MSNDGNVSARLPVWGWADNMKDTFCCQNIVEGSHCTVCGRSRDGVPYHLPELLKARRRSLMIATARLQRIDALIATGDRHASNAIQLEKRETLFRTVQRLTQSRDQLSEAMALFEGSHGINRPVVSRDNPPPAKTRTARKPKPRPPRPNDPPQPNITAMCLTRLDLKERGWSSDLIDVMLGQPDHLAPHPRQLPIPMKLYEEDRVLAAEQTPEFMVRCTRNVAKRQKAIKAQAEKKAKWEARNQDDSGEPSDPHTPNT